MHVVVAMETQLFHACCNDNWSLYMHTTIKIQSRELFHHNNCAMVHDKEVHHHYPMSRFATILSTTVWRVQDETTMTSINIKDQQVWVTIESYAKKKKLHDYPFSCIHSHTSSYYLDLFYKNKIHYSLSPAAHQNSLWKGSDSFKVLIYDCQINYYNSHDTCPTLLWIL